MSETISKGDPVSRLQVDVARSEVLATRTRLTAIGLIEKKNCRRVPDANKNREQGVLHVLDNDQRYVQGNEPCSTLSAYVSLD